MLAGKLVLLAAAVVAAGAGCTEYVKFKRFRLDFTVSPEQTAAMIGEPGLGKTWQRITFAEPLRFGRVGETIEAFGYEALTLADSGEAHTGRYAMRATLRKGSPGGQPGPATEYVVDTEDVILVGELVAPLTPPGKRGILPGQIFVRAIREGELERLDDRLLIELPAKASVRISFVPFPQDYGFKLGVTRDGVSLPLPWKDDGYRFQTTSAGVHEIRVLPAGAPAAREPSSYRLSVVWGEASSQGDLKGDSIQWRNVRAPPEAAATAGAQAPSTRYSAEDEVYGQLEGPRLQFVWSAPGEPRPSIWSMKIDGSDLRRAAGPELLYSGDAESLVMYPAVPVRSPDGRYIACAGSTGDRILLFLVDLKEKKVGTMTPDQHPDFAAFHFAWTPDSKQVVFQDTTDGYLYQYDVDGDRLVFVHRLNDSKRDEQTGRFEQWTTRIYSRGIQLVDEGRRIVGVTDDAIDYLDRAGKVVKRIAPPKRLQSTPRSGRAGAGSFSSSDGRVLALVPDRIRRVVVSIDDLEKPLYEDEDWYFHSALAPDGKTLYRLQGRAVLVVDLTSKRMSRIAQLPEGHGSSVPGGLTVFGGG